LLTDPSNGLNTIHLETNVAGIGMMYRIINVKGVFADLSMHNFNNQSCKVKITIKDTFISTNNGSAIINFENGKNILSDMDDYQVEITLDVSDFSSLIMGAIDFKALFNIGLAEISDESYINTIHRIFYTEHKPVCKTDF
jgi:predicted acetyltransferase